MKLDHGKLREIAEKATPGPWEHGGCSVTNWHDHTFEMEWIANGQDAEAESDGVNSNAEADGLHIATFDPPTVLALLSEHSVLTEEVERGAAQRADELQDVVAALYKAWPDAEDIASDWPLGIIGSIEQIISERDSALASLRVCRESLTEQAGARRDPTMPVLVPEVIEAWANEAEASYAMAETAEERRNAHGLSLLIEWQRRALQGLGAGDQGAAQSQWQDIASAPKDGRRFLGLFKGEVCECRRYDDAWGVGVATFNGQVWAGKSLTHWMPLPSPPEQGGN